MYKSNMLSEIEVVKTVSFSLALTTLSLATPQAFSFLKSSKGLNFIPDFVRVKSASYFDVTNASIGTYDVHCNFIRDQGTLVSITPQPITNATQFCPDLLHMYVDAEPLYFNVVIANDINNPANTAVINLTLEFVKLKKNKLFL
jgi:hypothetical protein